MPPNPSIERKIAAFSVIGLMGLTAGYTSYYYEHHFYDQPAPVAQVQLQHYPSLHLDPAALTAKAAVLIDPQTGDILFAKNPELQLPLASLTKLATARAVLSSANNNQMVVIKQEDLKPDGDSGLHVGDVWRLADLVAFGLTTSSNDAMAAAASALSSNTAIARMNEEARQGDMPQSYFLNPTGLDISSSTAGAYGSALDVAHLVDDMLRTYPAVFEATIHPPKLSGKSGKGAESTTEPLWNMPGLIAAKTGYTDLAGGNLAVAVDLGLAQPVIAVVLGSTRDGRFDDVRMMVETMRTAIAHDH